MQPVPPAVTNPARLTRLQSLHLLDSPAEVAFDRLTRLASQIIDAPVSLVSLVDADRQFFKSAFGLPEPWLTARQTPLSHSFCQYVVATGDPLVVRDAREHPVLKDNLAVPDLNVIAYLGIPLTTSDQVELGSFCVIDSKPRTWTPREIEIVRELALSVMTEIELRAQIMSRLVVEEELRQRNRQYERVYDFAATTLDQLNEGIARGATPAEIKTYVRELQHELVKLDTAQPVQ